MGGFRPESGANIPPTAAEIEQTLGAAIPAGQTLTSTGTTIQGKQLIPTSAQAGEYVIVGSTAGTFAQSSMFETIDEVQSNKTLRAKGLKTKNRSIDIGPNMRVSNSGDNIEFTSIATNDRRSAAYSPFDNTTGSLTDSFLEFRRLWDVDNAVIQSDSSENSSAFIGTGANTVAGEYRAIITTSYQAFDALSQRYYVRGNADVTGVRARFFRGTTLSDPLIYTSHDDFDFNAGVGVHGRIYGQALTGTVSLNATVNVVGVGTAFDTELEPKDTIVIAGVEYIVKSVTDATNLVLENDGTRPSPTVTLAAQTFTRGSTILDTQGGFHFEPNTSYLVQFHSKNGGVDIKGKTGAIGQTGQFVFYFERVWQDIEKIEVPNAAHFHLAMSPQILGGTGSITINTDTVTGVGTNFTTQFQVGDAFDLNGQIFTVKAITDDTHLTTNEFSDRTVSGIGIYRHGDLFNLLDSANRSAIKINPQRAVEVSKTLTAKSDVKIIGVSSKLYVSNIDGTPSNGITLKTDADESLASYKADMITSNDNAPRIVLNRYRGTTASPTATLDGDRLGQIWMGGHNSVSVLTSAAIKGRAVGNWDATSRGAKIEIETTPQGVFPTALSATFEANGDLTLEKTIQIKGGVIGTGTTALADNARLRLTAASADTQDNSRGASIDLHGNQHVNAGRLDLVAGGTSSITAWTNDTQQLEIDQTGKAIFEQQVQIKGGVPGSGKVLTSDATGLATWQAQTIPAAGSNTQVQFNSSGSFAADAAFNWDNTNKRLGIGTTAPRADLHSKGTILLGNRDTSTETALGLTTNITHVVSATNIGAAAGTVETALRLFRDGTSGTKYNMSADFQIGSYATTGINSQTELKLRLNNGATHLPDTDIISFKASGIVEVYNQIKIAGGSPGAGKVLTSDADGLGTWQTPSVSAAGSSGQIQFNSSGSFAGDTNLLWDATNDRLSIGTTNATAAINLAGAAGASSTTSASIGDSQIRFKQVSGDQADSGVIAYKVFDVNALDIVGAGTVAGSRVVRVWDNLTIGDVANSKAVATLTSTSKGFMPPRWTDAQQTTNTAALTAGDEGMMWFNTTTKQFMGWSGTAAVIIG